MTNYSSKILNIAVSSVNAQQAVLGGISNNIANANTPGYTRRTVLLSNNAVGGSAGGINIGSGVKVEDLIRYVDEFTNKSLRESTAEKFAAETRDDMLARAEAVFELTGERSTIGSTMTDFFSSLNDLALNPSSVELRSNVIQRAEDLVYAIKTSYQTLSDIQLEMDKRIVTEVDAVNTLTAQIASLNGSVTRVENSGRTAADERDRRDYLLGELSKKISFTTTETSDGTINVTLPSGLDLVSGSLSRSLSVTKTPTFLDANAPTMLGGATPNYVVFDYGGNGTQAHVDLTSEIGNGAGTLGGVLQVRGLYDTGETSPFEAKGPISETAARIESIARFLLVDFNQAYRGADEDSTVAGFQASTGDLDGQTPGVYGFFDFAFDGVKDVDGDGLADDLDNHTGISNYASLLQLTSSDPRDIAVALDLNGADGATSFAPGDGSNIANLTALSEVSQTFSVGDYTFTGTVHQVYVDAVSFIGNAKSTAAVDRTVAEFNYKISADRRDQEQGVSIDEEFSQLVVYQRAYEASARLIRLADELLKQIVDTL